MPPVPKFSWQPDKIFQVQKHLFTLTPLAVKIFTRFASAWKWFDQSWPQTYPRAITALGKGIVIAWTKESWISGATGDLLCPTGQNTAMGIPAMMGKWLLILSFQGATPWTFICCKVVSGWRWKKMWGN